MSTVRPFLSGVRGGQTQASPHRPPPAGSSYRIAHVLHYPPPSHSLTLSINYTRALTFENLRIVKQQLLDERQRLTSANLKRAARVDNMAEEALLPHAELTAP